MAAKFKIRFTEPVDVDNHHPADKRECFWVLYDKDGLGLVKSVSNFATEKEARSDIAAVKRACTTYTKVVTEI